MEVGAVPLLSVVAVIVTVATYAVTRWVEARRTQRALTIELWKMWRSKELRKDQTDVHRAFAAIEKGSGIELSELEPEIRHALGNVEHFLVEAAALKRRGLLDDGLFADLFRDSLPPWQQLSGRMSRREHVEADFGGRMTTAYATLRNRKTI